MKRLALLPLLVLPLAACGGGATSAKTSTSTSVSTNTSTSSSANPSSSSQTSSSSAKSGDLAEKIKAANPMVTSLTELTQANDTNHELGRPNGYSSATVLNVKGQTCDGAPGVACGATVEQFDDASAAQARAKYIQTAYKAAAGLGSEYDYVSGGAVLRITGKLDPAAAAKLAAPIDGKLVKAN